ncbi:hypothetical protein [Maricaulis maris]|uniref:hypothetical protein n=1 Tax=Maricaulis maris TaxID=74318 RepID=UPI003B8B1BD7
MNWDLLDFLIAAAMLAVLVGGGVALFRGRAHRACKLAGVGLLVANLLLFWINGAVGIIGASGNDANLAYFLVPAIGLAGAILQAVRGRGFATACLASVVVLTVLASVALVMGWGRDGPAWPWDIVVITVFFVGVFVIVGVLHRHGERAHAAFSRSR